MSTSALSPRAAVTRRRHVPPIGALGWIAIGSVALALLSLLLPTTPTYDPYAWLIWGREVLHLDLDTDFGPSWKPLPVVFTTLFGLVPSAAPDLWVAVARAGAIASIPLALRVAWRLGGGLTGGLVAAACLIVSTGYLRFAWIGDSEGILVALLLAGIDLHLSGRRRAALWMAFGACLLRPEAWVFAVVYAAWLWRAEPKLHRTTLGMVIGGALVWFGPELWGSGDLLRSSQRALDPNPDAIAFADFPAWEAVKRTVEMTPWPARIGVLVVAAGWVSGRWRDRAVGLVTLGALAWTVEVAVMTQRGYSGNARYMLAPVALACVVGGVGWARLFALAGRFGRTAASAGTAAGARPGRGAAGGARPAAGAGLSLDGRRGPSQRRAQRRDRRLGRSCARARVRAIGHRAVPGHAAGLAPGRPHAGRRPGPTGPRQRLPGRPPAARHPRCPRHRRRRPTTGAGGPLGPLAGASVLLRG